MGIDNNCEVGSNSYLGSLKKCKLMTFRAWDKKQKEMCVVREIDYAMETALLVFKGYQLFRKFDDIVLMHSTCLLDKNEVEICEHDIVEIPDGLGTKVVITFNGIYFSFNNSSNISHLLNKERSSELRVVGNKHNNPKLFESVNKH